MVKRIPLKDAFSKPDSPLFGVNMRNRLLLMRHVDKWFTGSMRELSICDINGLRLLGIRWYNGDGSIDWDSSCIIVVDGGSDKVFPYELYYSLKKGD